MGFFDSYYLSKTFLLYSKAFRKLIFMDLNIFFKFEFYIIGELKWSQTKWQSHAQ